MALRMFKTLGLLSLILIIIISLVSGKVEGVKKSNDSPLINRLQEEGNTRIMIVKSRKLLSINGATVLDYDDAEPNPRHDPRRKRSNP